MYTPLASLPAVSRDPQDLDKFADKLLLGNDLEWSQHEVPTILGISDGTLTCSVPFNVGVERFKWLLATYPNASWVGHNFVAADLIVLRRLGIHFQLDKIEDTILWMWLVNMHLAKATGKSALVEDGDERRGRGFFNLWTMLSIYTDLWNYKDCRGEGCIGPCPEHDKYGYNGIDALGPVQALPKLKRAAQLRGVDKLYPMHRELALVLAEMQEFGVRIDVPYVYGRDKHPLGTTYGDSLDEQFRKEKTEIEQTLPFNPKSPKVVVEHFKKLGIEMENAQEETVRDLVEELGEQAPVELVSLLDYKELGNGADRWFNPQYRNKDGWLEGYLDPRGYVHPRLNFFTSSGRLACSSPNFQNVAKRRRSRKMCECGAKLETHPTAMCQKFRGESVGKKIRKAIIAPEGWYIVRADLSNAENRVVLHFGGYTIDRETDLHNYVKDLAGITEEDPFALANGNAREAAKTIQHAGNILEGLQLKTPDELRGPKIRKEISVGARVVFPNWTFCKKVVTFTGANLAQRAFGDKSYENRQKALAIAEKYFGRFPGVRDFQRRVSKACETENVVRVPCGYVLLSYGEPNDRMKIAQGMWQQNPVAHIIKLATLRMWARWKAQGNYRPILNVHDECLAYVRNDVAPDVAKRWITEDMEVAVEQIPGLLIPAEATTGVNWRDQR